MDRRLRWKIKRYQEGKCINCGEVRETDEQHPKGIYAKLCIKCAIKNRLRVREARHTGGWEKGKPGRPPKVKIKLKRKEQEDVRKQQDTQQHLNLN